MMFNMGGNVYSSFGKNSSLLSNNNFFNMIKKDKYLYLVHVTKNKDLIEKSGFIFPSGGCLLGSVYFTPGYKNDDNKIRLHNLGRYYYEKECPSVIKDRGLGGEPFIYIIKLKLEDTVANISAVNYLTFGKMHFEIYNYLNYLLTDDEKNKLEKIVYLKLRSAFNFLVKIKKVKDVRDVDSKLDFVNELIQNVKNLPILGYIYFEALNKTLMLHQTDDMSQKYYKVGEFYNWHYKNMMVYFYPDFFSKFNLGTFSLPLNDAFSYIRENNLVENMYDFEIEFCDNIFQFLDQAFCLNEISDNFKLEEIRSKIKDTAVYYYPIIGHIVHRELRNFKRYPDFYFYFDQIKALYIWNYWNKHNVVIPYNSIIPKGEVGLNPAYLDNLEYEVFEGINYNVVDDFAYVDIGKKVDVKIAKKLIENKYGLMRNYVKNVNE